MKMQSTSGYGDAPLGVECAFPGTTPRLAQTGTIRAGIWRRMVYRIRYGVKVASAVRPVRAV